MGDGASQQAVPVFLQNTSSDRLNVGLAVLGRGVGFEGTGELFRVRLSEPVDLAAVVIDARNLKNELLAVRLVDHADGSIPRAFELSQNFPNPFNPTTTIAFGLPEPSTVSLTIFSVDGRRVRTLVNDHREAGRFVVAWDGRDDQGRSVASGAYFYRLVAEKRTSTKKMVLMK